MMLDKPESCTAIRFIDRLVVGGYHQRGGTHGGNSQARDKL